MENVCRTCLRASEDELLPLYDNSEIIYKIETIASIKIIEDENFPSNICQECFNNVNKLFNFRKVILHSDKELHERQITLEYLKNKPDLSSNTTKSDDDNDNDDDNIVNLVKIEDNHEDIETSNDIILSDDDVDGDGDNNTNSIKTDVENIEQVLMKLKELKCTECNETFKSRIKLSNHRRTEHLPRGMCNICGISIRQDNLKKHVKMHTENPVACRECNKTFKNSESLRCHMLAHRDTIFTCEICGKQLKIKSEYSRHIKVHYDPECRKSTCKVCNKRVKDLKRHMYSHTGERPFICLYCNRGFTSSHSLKVHTRSHTNEKPYKCEFCPMAFPQKVSLTTHLRSKHDCLI